MTIDDEEPVLADPIAEARRKSLPTFAEAQAATPPEPTPGPLRTFVRDEMNKLREEMRGLRQDINELKKLVG